MSGGASPSWRTMLLALLLFMATALRVAASASEGDVLLNFKKTITDDTGALSSWTSTNSTVVSPCTGHHTRWKGVYCEGGMVIKLVMENMSLGGSLDLDALVDLPHLRSVSFTNNSFHGGLPAVDKLGKLRSIYLAYNSLEGDIADDAFSGLGALKIVHLEHNGFTGPIPTSLALAPRLTELSVQENRFTGSLPDFQQGDQLKLNVSYNHLQGAIPASLSGEDSSRFIGNTDLCGKPLDIPCNSSTAPTPTTTTTSSNSKKPSTPLLIVIVVIAIAVALAIIGAVLAGLRRRRVEEPQLGRPPSYSSKKSDTMEADHLEQGSTGGSSSSSSRKKKAAAAAAAAAREADQSTKLVFVREDRERFELQDLLRASAEVLGSGGFGSSYKAMLLSGPTMVVKRFREMNGVGREEFQEHMRRLGSLSHQNLLPLVAYYYRKEEKLLVTDHVCNGSLAHLLHGNRTSNHPSLDWPTRLKIVKGVARGLLYLYNELPMLAIPHGHLKSSNVLLDDTFEPLLTDYALSPVMNPAHASDVMVAYRSPEYEQHGRTTKKSDVWSLGILILEILTGKYPDNFVRRRRGSSSGSSNGGGDLASWVNSVVREEWTGEVFDGGMGGTKSGEGEMLKLLQIGLACCEADVGRRWEMAEAVEKIVELKERDGDEDFSSSYVSDGEVHSSHHVTEEEENFSFSASTNA